VFSLKKHFNVTSAKILVTRAEKVYSKYLFFQNSIFIFAGSELVELVRIKV
jgi:hypothetical protein